MIENIVGGGLGLFRFMVIMWCCDILWVSLNKVGETRIY
jgi:hypothetical protein